MARFWASTEVALPHDGTAVDALRDGLSMLAGRGVPVRDRVIVLLPALYVALVARDDEQVYESGERAEAWAWGLPDDSSLVPVADVMITALRRGLSVDATLGHLFAVLIFTEPVAAADRRFTADPGTALITLAFELGHRQVITRDRKVIPLEPGGADLIQAQIHAFEEKFGRPPGPEDPIFFDPDADEPRPARLADMEQYTTDLLQAAGISGAWIYAYQHTDGLLPRPDGTFNSDADRRDWDEQIDRYLRAHPGTTVDHDLQLAKLRTVLALSSIAGAATDSTPGASLARRLDSLDSFEDEDTVDGEAEVVAEFLDASADMLVGRLAEHDVTRTAEELARAWSGADLASRVRAVTSATESDGLDSAVLLAIAAASIGRPSRMALRFAGRANGASDVESLWRSPSACPSGDCATYCMPRACVTARRVR